MHNLLLQVSGSDGYELNNFFALKLSTLCQLRLRPVVPNGINALYIWHRIHGHLVLCNIYIITIIQTLGPMFHCM